MNLIAIILVITSTAWSFVQVNPVRLSLNNSRFSHFTVKNTQSKPIKIEIENKYYNMLPDGSMTPEKVAQEENIKKVIFSPQAFTLLPGGKQVVRFFIKDQTNQTELRSYVYLLSEEKNEIEENSLSKENKMELRPKIAIAIPLLFRSKTIKENIELTEIKGSKKENDCILEMTWKNKHHSSYINLEVLGAENKSIFKLNGVSNYLSSFNWQTKIPKTDCTIIKKIKIFDVDNEVYVLNSELQL